MWTEIRKKLSFNIKRAKCDCQSDRPTHGQKDGKINTQTLKGRVHTTYMRELKKKMEKRKERQRKRMKKTMKRQ